MKTNLWSKLFTLLMTTAFLGSPFQKCFADDKKDDTAPKPSASAGSTASFVSNMDALNDKRKLVVGDMLSFRVVEDEDAPHTLGITDSGEMEVPYIGRVEASGKTCKQLANEIKAVLEKQYYYKATVIIGLDSAGKGMSSRGKLYVMGQVRNEGPQDVPVDEVYTVKQAILRAGGFAQYANKRKVKIMRPSKTNKGDSETIIVDCVDVLDKGITSKDVALEPEDIVVVPEKFINF